MKLIKIYILLVTMFATLPVQALLLDTRVFYLNGIQNDRSDIQASLIALSTNLDGQTVEPLFNPSAGKLVGIVDDLTETVELNDSLRGQGFTKISYVVAIIKGFVSPPERVADRIAEIIVRAQVDALTGTSPSIEEFLANELPTLDLIRTLTPFQRILIISHSEGTAFSNTVYRRMARVTENNKNKCVRQVHIGAIANGVDNGSYTTGRADRVINAARASGLFGNVLVANVNNLSTVPSIIGHNLDNVYLADQTTRVQIQRRVGEEGTSLVNSCSPPPECPDALLQENLKFSRDFNVYHFELPVDLEDVHNIQFNHINNGTIVDYIFSTSPVTPTAVTISGEPLLYSRQRTFDNQLDKDVFTWPTLALGHDIYLHARGVEGDSEYSFCLSCNEGDSKKCNTGGLDRNLGEGHYQITWDATGYDCGACLTGSVSTRPTNNCGFGPNAPRWYPNILEGVDLPISGNNTSAPVTLVKGETYDLTFDGICQCQSIHQNCRGLNNTGRVGWSVREIFDNGTLGPVFYSVNRSIGTALRRQIDVPAN